MSDRKFEPTENLITVGNCIAINYKAALGGLPTMFEQPEVQFNEFNNYPMRPEFVWSHRIRRSDHGGVRTYQPSRPHDGYIYRCVHVHAMYVYIHMHMRNACLYVAVRLASFFLVQRLYYAIRGVP